MNKNKLDNVTLFALSNRRDIHRTSIAIDYCLKQMEFGNVIHLAPFEDKELKHETENRKIIRELNQVEYSKFMINNLYDYINTDYVITVQWDGFIIDANRWKNNFFEYDYIGAPWEFVGSKNNVGNGGFSLRSKKMLKICKNINFNINECTWFHPLQAKHRPIPPEDWYICYHSYEILMRNRVRFPSVGLARSFSVENSHMNSNFYDPMNIETYKSFGFHGVNNIAAMELLNA